MRYPQFPASFLPFLLLFFPVVCCPPVRAQDAASQAIMMNQQATQAALQANQAAIQANQQANQQAAASAQASENTCCAPNPVWAPKFSVKAGTYPGPTTVRMKDRTRGTVIFYTTDGWTPTMASMRYVGPITIGSTTVLQAIAVTPTNQRSAIARAEYKLPGVADAGPVPVSLSSGSIVTHGFVLPLVFTAAVTSKGMQVGDAMPIALARDVVADGVVVAPKGTPVVATVIQVDKNGLEGAPGTLTFEVHSITIAGQVVPLAGVETMEGVSRSGQRYTWGAALLSLAGPAGALVHGGEAEIPEGATLTATVISDTPLRATN